MPEDYSPAPNIVQIQPDIWLCTLHLPKKENTHGQEGDQDPLAIPIVECEAQQLEEKKGYCSCSLMLQHPYHGYTPLYGG